MSKKDECLINKVTVCEDCFLCLDEQKACIHPHDPQENIDLLAIREDCPLIDSPLLICIKDYKSETKH